MARKMLEMLRNAEFTQPETVRARRPPLPGPGGQAGDYHGGSRWFKGEVEPGRAPAGEGRELLRPSGDERVRSLSDRGAVVIAESTKKTDRLDAQVLTEFLVLDMIPESYQPTPRQRQHRALVRHRQYLQGRITSVRSKIRHILSNYNADRKDLFSANCGPAYLKEVRLSDVDRFVIKQLWAEWQDHLAQRLAVSKKLKAFVAEAAAGSRGPGDPQDRPGWVRDGRGGPQRAGRHQPIPQRQGCLCLRGTGAGGTAERGEEIQGHEDHQGRLGTVAVGTGGGRLAAGRQQPEMGSPVRSVDASQR